MDEGEKAFEESQQYEIQNNHYTSDIILKRLEIQNKVNKREINNEIRILKSIDDYIRANKFNKFNLNKEQKEDLNRIRRVEILKYQILEKSKSDEEISKEFRTSKENYSIGFYKNSKDANVNNFNLTYNQRMIALFDKENLKENFSAEQIKAMSNEIQKADSQRKIVNEYQKRKEVEESLRRRKRYHLSDVKKMKTSLDKYSEENEYYLVKSFKESGINVNKNKENNKAAFRSQSPKI